MSAIAIFAFENSKVRTLGTPESPLFVAVDVAAALGYSQPAKSVNDRVDKDDIIKQEIETAGGRQTVNCVNESGLYALIFGSKLESAKRFKRWVTSEVLPAIRRTGQYQCPIASITTAQQFQLREAVAARAKSVSAHYQTIYRALYARFQIPRYSELLAKDFDAAMEFIRTVDLRTPERIESQEKTKKPEPTPRTDGQVLVSRSFLESQLTFVYLWKYLYRPVLDRFYLMLKMADSPHAPRLWEAIHDLHLSMVERDLEQLGFAVKQMKEFKFLVSQS